MKLKLTRKTYTKTSTIGDLQINGKFECHVLEDPVRAEKNQGRDSHTRRELQGRHHVVSALQSGHAATGGCAGF